MRFIIKLLQMALGGLFALLTVGAVAAFFVYNHYAPQLPGSEDLRKIEVQVPLRIYTRENELVAEYGERRSRPVKLTQVPQKLQQAFLDIEDARFYQHNGIDFKGVARAFFSVVSTGSASQGASTITMQLARNAFLDAGKNIERKLKETLLAIKIEQNLSKDEILELYLNKIYLGNRAYGVASAAETYYGKTLAELTLAQSAMIAGLPKAPSRYNPIVNPERAMQRRNYILQRMLEFGHITDADYQAAVNEPNTAQVHKTEISTNAPYLAEMVRAEVVKRFGEENAYTQGYHVYTTLDSKQQAEAEDALRAALLAYDRRHGYRGAEDTLNLREFRNEEEMLDKLSTYTVSGDLQPALVLEVANDNATLLVDEKRITLGMEAVRWARAFKSADRRGGVPARMGDVLKPGEIVRVRKTDKDQEKWTLSQVPAVGGALVSLDPADGAIRAVMGGFDFFHSKFNRATQAMRQPGSSFKPIVYAAALAKGFSPSSIVKDEPISIPGSNWKPENYGGRYAGPITIREALIKSRNLASIHLLRTAGIDYTVNYATRFGFLKENLPPNLTLALGTGMTTPLEMATAYAAFANGGFKVNPYFITRIEDSEGKVLVVEKPIKVCGDDVRVCVQPSPQEEAKKTDKGKGDKKDDKKVTRKPIWETEGMSGEPEAEELPPLEEHEYPAAKRILDKRTHYQMITMLQGVIRSGTAAQAGKAMSRKDIAGKTGTTNDEKDAWFCGFNPKIVSVVWVGFDDMSELGRGELAGNVALPMWIDYMRTVLADVPVKEWSKPAGIKESELALNVDSSKKVSRPASQPASRPRAQPQTPPGEFRFSEGNLVAPRYNPQQPHVIPAQPARRPERVEIPEQLF